MWLAVAVAAALLATARGSSCTAARWRCAYRTGCGTALNNYMLLCADVLSEPRDHCPEQCQHALIALTSTDEGKELMNCRCEEEDGYCKESKERIDVCRPQVLKAAANVTSCRLSQLICVADSQCATALDYYHRLCRSMYKGRKCSNKCLNSIEILKKQEKAAALTACQCDGYEDYDCPRMQNNLQRLCYHRDKNNKGHGERRKDKEKVHKTHPNEIKDSSASIVSVTLYLMLTLSSVILFIS